MNPIKTLLISLFIFVSTTSYSKASNNVVSANIKTTTDKTSEVEDPDLQLSIEELRKKYPIDWLEKKYGKYIDGGCEDPGDSEEEIKERAICLFFYDKESLNLYLEKNRESIFVNRSASTEQILNTLSAKFLDVFNDLSESEIKSVIVHYNEYSSESRVRDIVNIMLNQISDSNFLHSKKTKIRNFFYSKVIATSTSLSCANMKNLDVQDRFYDTFAINYLRQFINPPILTSVDSAAKSCIDESKFSQIKELLNQPQKN